jgi:hypothetical protein
MRAVTRLSFEASIHLPSHIAAPTVTNSAHHGSIRLPSTMLPYIPAMTGALVLAQYPRTLFSCLYTVDSLFLLPSVPVSDARTF